MEGWTSYYEDLIVRRAGFITPEEYINRMQSTVNYVEGSVGTRVQPVAHASFDAWVKAYRPNENSANTTMTYYSRGGMLAAQLDAKIIAKYKGEKSLDHFLRVLYNKYYKELNRGFSEKEFKEELAKFMGENMDDFFAKYVDGTEVTPLNETFGLRVNDEIIGCNGFRVDQKSVDDFGAGLSAGDKFSILISRDEILLELEVSMENYLKPQYVFKVNGSDAKKTQLRNYWLRTI